MAKNIMTFTSMHVGASAVLVYMCADTCINPTKTRLYMAMPLSQAICNVTHALPFAGIRHA